jgi:ketosteroid isomerase-like protein
MRPRSGTAGKCRFWTKAAVLLCMESSTLRRDTAQAMSEENVEIVRSFYRAWARNDLPGPVELIDPEIEYVNPVRAVEPGTRRGRATFGRAVEKVFDGWERWEIELEQLRPVGDQVAVVLRYRNRVLEAAGLQD